MCPVKINIPEILIHLRRRIVEADPPRGEGLAMRAASLAFSGGGWLSLAQRLGRLAQWPFVDGGKIRSLPGPAAGWTETRDLPAVPAQTFREWWAARKRNGRGSPE